MQNLSTAGFTGVARFFIIMEDITSFFPSSSKKRHISDTSKTDEDPKKIREASSAYFADEGDVFNERSDSSGCREILLNCLKNLEAKVMEIYEQGNENKNMHIKGEKQLIDLMSWRKIGKKRRK